jgi:hypothetical protein
MITKPVPALLCAPTGHNPTSRTTPELATALATAPVALDAASAEFAEIVVPFRHFVSSLSRQPT